VHLRDGEGTSMIPESTAGPEHAARQFATKGEFLGLRPHVRGHIHDTFVSTWTRGAEQRRYIHQRMNDRVFTDIPGLMHNIELVTHHLQAGAKDHAGDMTVLRLVPTREGHPFLQHLSGPWRTYEYIDNTESFDRCESTDRAFEAARAFGSFQARLLGLNARDLRETLPRFFSSVHRLEQLRDACEADVMGRVPACRSELDFVDAHVSEVGVIEACLAANEFPARVVHGDTKLNNVLFDQGTGHARCVVDLDTCMPGYSLYDFGDLVRFTAATCGEDEQDTDKAGVDFDLYDALVAGYLESASKFLTRRERDLMPFAARLVTFTIGMRFLADHLSGDVYFKIDRPGQNLDRARVQFRMVEEMERHKKRMAVR
jgi:hypothetical protein